MDNDELEVLDNDTEFLKSILNSVAGNGALPEGVEIIEKLDIESEVKKVFESLKSSEGYEEDIKDNPAIYDYEVKSDLSGITPVESYTIVTDEQEHGIVSLPKYIIVFEFEGETQVLNSDPIWFVFSGVEVADEMILQTQEMTESFYTDEDTNLIDLN